VETIENDNWLAMIAALALSVIMAFNVWSTIAFILDAVLQMFCGERSTKARNLFLSINQYLVNNMAARIFGINVKHMDLGEVTVRSAGTAGARDKELHTKIDRMEKVLNQVLARKLINEAEDVTVGRTSVERKDPEL
jgi:hypothetical protein